MDPTTPRTALSFSGALRSKAAPGERKYRNSSNVPSIRWTTSEPYLVLATSVSCLSVKVKLVLSRGLWQAKHSA